MSFEEFEKKWKQVDDGEKPTFHADNVEYATWEQYGKQFFGMRRKVTHKRHGVVRIVEPNGPIIEATYKDGALHGLYRRIDKDGVRVQVSKNGRPKAMLDFNSEFEEIEREDKNVPPLLEKRADEYRA